MSLSKRFALYFTIPNWTIKGKVSRKRISQGAGYGLEIPVQKFQKLLRVWKKQLRIIPCNNFSENKWVLPAWKLFFHPVLCPLYRKLLRQFSFDTRKNCPSYDCRFYKCPFHRDIFIKILTVSPSMYGNTVPLEDVLLLKGVCFNEVPLYQCKDI